MLNIDISERGSDCRIEQHQKLKSSILRLINIYFPKEYVFILDSTRLSREGLENYIGRRVVIFLSQQSISAKASSDILHNFLNDIRSKELSATLSANTSCMIMRSPQFSSIKLQPLEASRVSTLLPSVVMALQLFFPQLRVTELSPQFVLTSISEIEKNVEVILKLSKNKSSFFSRLPEKALIGVIASMTGTSYAHTQKEAEEIAGLDKISCQASL